MTKSIKKLTLTFIFTILAIILSFGSVKPYYAKAENEQVFLGGTPIGIIAESDGLTVTEIINVTSDEGCFSPALRAGITRGDVILSVNDKKILNASELNALINSSAEPLKLTILRGDRTIDLPVNPVFDLVQNAKKIGISVKNNIAGIGTMTFVKNNGDYGALGHQIIDSFGNGDIYGKGKVFYCDISGYNVATNDTPGELIGKVNLEKDSIGNIEKNKFCGIFGHLDNTDYYNEREKITLGTMSDVKPGKATIVTTIGNGAPKKYEIEIVKTYIQAAPEEKGMVIRVTDKELLSTTKGILQGMSGSPIIQNNKLVGAVTHVFTNDSTMGFGVFIDWMINEA